MLQSTRLEITDIFVAELAQFVVNICFGILFIVFSNIESKCVIVEAVAGHKLCMIYDIFNCFPLGQD